MTPTDRGRAELMAFADSIIALDARATHAEEMERRLRDRFLLAQADAGGFMEQRDALAAEMRVVKADFEQGAEHLAEAIETLKWIYHGHTNNAENIRDVVKRRLDSLRVIV